eukprot:Hpha_TRINITY_DN15976_c1_g4::TRINITY_DN15976_c1_g4_i1::g.73927::m.73927
MSEGAALLPRSTNHTQTRRCRRSAHPKAKPWGFGDYDALAADWALSWGRAAPERRAAPSRSVQQGSLPGGSPRSRHSATSQPASLPAATPRGVRSPRSQHEGSGHHSPPRPDPFVGSVRVVAPRPVFNRALGGRYVRQDGMANGAPLWRRVDDQFYLYRSRDGRWCIRSTDTFTDGGGYIKSAPSELDVPAPHLVAAWEVARGEDTFVVDPEIRCTPCLPHQSPQSSPRRVAHKHVGTPISAPGDGSPPLSPAVAHSVQNRSLDRFSRGTPGCGPSSAPGGVGTPPVPALAQGQASPHRTPYEVALVEVLEERARRVRAELELKAERRIGRARLECAQIDAAKLRSELVFSQKVLAQLSCSSGLPVDAVAVEQAYLMETSRLAGEEAAEWGALMGEWSG